MRKGRELCIFSVKGLPRKMLGSPHVCQNRQEQAAFIPGLRVTACNSYQAARRPEDSCICLKCATEREHRSFYKQLNLCDLSNSHAWGSLLQDFLPKLSRITDWKDKRTGLCARCSQLPLLHLLLWVSSLPKHSAVLHLPHALVGGGRHKIQGADVAQESVSQPWEKKREMYSGLCLALPPSSTSSSDVSS